jgi:heme A synthase
MAIVLGIASTNLFTSIIFASMVHSDKWSPTAAYICTIATWAMFGTCVGLSETVWINYIHVFAAGLLFVSSAVLATLGIYTRKLQRDPLCVIMLGVMVAAVTTCVVTSVVTTYTTTSVWYTLLAIAELVYVFTYSMLLSYLFTDTLLTCRQPIENHWRLVSKDMHPWMYINSNT